MDRSNPSSHNRILAAKLRKNYEKIDPVSYGYNLPKDYIAKDYE
jgi:hypothetical protein